MEEAQPALLPTRFNRNFQPVMGQLHGMQGLFLGHCDPSVTQPLHDGKGQLPQG